MILLAPRLPQNLFRTHQSCAMSTIFFSWASCWSGNADPGSVNCSRLGPRDAVVGVFFHRSPRDNFAIVGSQLSRHRNSFLALGQRTRPKFTVFTFFLHPHYKIANSIEKIDLMRMISCAFQSRVSHGATDIVTAESKESHFMVNIATSWLTSPREGPRALPGPRPAGCRGGVSALRKGSDCLQLADSFLKKAIDILY